MRVNPYECFEMSLPSIILMALTNFDSFKFLRENGMTISKSCMNKRLSMGTFVPGSVGISQFFKIDPCHGVILPDDFIAKK